MEAYSWLARGALEEKQYDQAPSYAKETKALALEQLKKRSLDAEPHLPLALGAAFEVQSQVLAAHGQRTQAMAVLQSALADVWQHIHSRSTAEEPEPAFVSGEAGAGL